MLGLLFVITALDKYILCLLSYPNREMERVISNIFPVYSTKETIKFAHYQKQIKKEVLIVSYCRCICCYAIAFGKQLNK